MNTISLSTLRKDIRLYLDKAETDCEELIITRGKGRKAVVVNYDDYMALKETAYLLTSPANRAHLTKSLQEQAQNKTVRIEL